MTVLAADNLSCGYGRDDVLHELSLEARPGELLAIVGPNGAGKTTLIRALARTLKPRRGAVRIEGQPLASLPASAVARAISYSPQSERRDWPLSVEDAVRLGRAPHRGWLLPFNDEDRQVVEQVLRQTGLGPLRDRPITELSGGEWRRMMLARALAQQAKVMLFDEPTAALDLKYQIEILDLFRQLTQDQQLTVVLSLHDLNLASLYVDRIVMLHEGRVAADGRPAEVLTEEIVSRVYGIAVSIVEHPVHGTPMVVPAIGT